MAGSPGRHDDSHATCDLLLTARRVFNLGIALVGQTALFINPSESVACASHMSVKVSTVRVGIH